MQSSKIDETCVPGRSWHSPSSFESNKSWPCLSNLFGLTTPRISKPLLHAKGHNKVLQTGSPDLLVEYIHAIPSGLHPNKPMDKGNTEMRLLGHRLPHIFDKQRRQQYRRSLRLHTGQSIGSYEARMIVFPTNRIGKALFTWITRLETDCTDSIVPSSTCR